MQYQGISWELTKRFRDFDSLDEKLKANHGFMKVSLPEKRFWGRFDPNFLDERYIDLQNYVTQLLEENENVGSKMVSEFFEVLET